MIRLSRRQQNFPREELVVQQKVQIKSHQSAIFQNIRELDGIDAGDVEFSLKCEKNREMVFKAG